MANHAQAQRARLAGLLTGAGPDAPTLCAGWRTRDLVAHLLVRERRPDAAPGIQLPALAGWTRRVQDGYARRPYERLVREFRGGPPRLSLFALPGVDELANGVEYFVHAEDVRRAAPGGWEPEPLDPELTELLWRRLPLPARIGVGRRTPLRVQLRRADRPGLLTVGAPDGEPVEVAGEPAELLLFAFGRGARARVVVDGAPAAVDALRARLPLPAADASDG
ncbi:TIGR03085 family metal-binding protein [Kitasatospora sp. NPDC052896]|uniref:TIGR03085 family metal-binding protein n=1 Tax=Kitasatospora sp. NPDC052896 TaxID=3364061 RepID=UPI0037C8B950